MNKSLSALGNVINALTSGERRCVRVSKGYAERMLHTFRQKL